MSGKLSLIFIMFEQIILYRLHSEYESIELQRIFNHSFTILSLTYLYCFKILPTKILPTSAVKRLSMDLCYNSVFLL